MPQNIHVELDDLKMTVFSILLKVLKHASLETGYFTKMFYLKNDESSRLPFFWYFDRCF